MKRARDPRQQVRWPGAMLVAAGLSKVAENVLTTVYLDEILQGLKSLSPVTSMEGNPVSLLSLASLALTAVVSLLLVAGGIQMMRGRSWGLALTAAVLAMVPCVAPCCGLSIPVGIWAILVLNDPAVRETMRR